MQLKPGFRVVTFVLTILVVAGFFASWVKRYIPPGSPNLLAKSTEPFLSQAQYQPVKWFPTFADASSEAILRKRPILLVIGAAQTIEGRFLDDIVFSESSLAALINKECVPVRVDSFEHPQWENGFLSLSRLQMPNFGALQIWLLSPKGEIIGFLPPPRAASASERDLFVSMFGEILHRFRSASNYADALAAKQRSDRNAWAAQTGGATITEFATYLHQLIDPEFGGIQRDGIQKLWPQVWEFFVLLGRPHYAAYSLNAMVLSPQFDLQRGGFFTQTRDRERLQLVFCKGAVENAEMLRTLSIAGNVLHDPLYEFAAVQTLRWLTQGLTRESLGTGWEISIPNLKGRSPAYSYSLGLLVNVLTADERAFSKAVLNLDPSLNPSMVPYVRTRKDLLGQLGKIQSTLDKVESGLEQPQMVGLGLTRTNCRVLARCIEAVRLMDAKEEEVSILAAFARVRGAYVGGEVPRKFGINDRTASLVAWLAYSDMMLQMYFFNGDSRVLEDGLQVLMRAMSIFHSSYPGLLRLDRPATLPSWLSGSPEIVDNSGESAMAQLIRLYRAYSVLSVGRPEGTALQSALDDSLEACASMVKESSASLAGLFCARLIGLNQEYGFAVGPSATKLATEAKRLRPLQIWFSAVGTVRPDLQKRAPGLYWVSSGSTEGPLSSEQILRIVPDELNPNAAGRKQG